MNTDPVIVQDTAALLDKMRITPFRREFDDPTNRLPKKVCKLKVEQVFFPMFYIF